MQTLRQKIVRGIVEKIDRFNFPIWCNFPPERIDVDNQIVEVQRSPICHDDHEAISRQINDWQLAHADTDQVRYLERMSNVAYSRLVNEIGEQLRYRFYKNDLSTNPPAAEAHEWQA